jgi:Fe2+ transport system protein FeoA
VRLVNRAPFGGPVLLMVGDAHYAVSRDIAERVIVKEGGNSAP